MSRIILILALVFISGCGPTGFIDGAFPGDPNADSREELVIWHTYGEEETRIFENILIPRFEREHPDILITPVRQPHNQRLKTALIARATSGKIPDIVRMDIIWVQDLARLGLLVPVSDFHDFEETKSKLQVPTLETNFFKGKYYGLPLNMTTKIAIYNKAQLSRVGLKSPPATLPELLEAAEKSHSVLGIGGLHAWAFASYFHELGGQLLDPANSRASGYLNSPASANAVRIMQSLLGKGVIKKNILNGQVDLWGGLLRGELLMIDEGPWFYSSQATSNDVRDNILSTTVPAPFPGNSIVGGENLVINKGSKHVEAAWTFIKWMTGKEAGEEMFKAGVIPANTEAVIPQELQENPFIMAAIKGLKKPYMRPNISESDAVDGVFQKYMSLILDDRMTIQQGLDEAAVKIDALLGLD